MMETELKFRISSADAAQLWRRPSPVPVSPAQRRSIVTVYYDTPDLALRRHGIALRMRRIGRRWIQSIKGGGDVQGGLHRRREWECELDGEQPDFSRIDDPSLQQLFDRRLRKDLAPLFATTFQRTTRNVSLDGSVVEVAFDLGEIAWQDRSAPICELELELKSGRVASLYGLALQLLERAHLEPFDSSKAERGYLLAAPAPLTPVRAAPVALSPGQRTAEAFIAIVANCVAHLNANRDGFLAGDDPEYLHQMRVATRRLRSAFSLFSPHLPEADTAPLMEHMKWLGNALGTARDWDVLTLETLPALTRALAGDMATEPLTRRAAAERDLHLAQARQAVADRRYTRFLLELGRWLHEEGWTDRLDKPVEATARRLLAQRHKRLAKAGDDLSRASAEERHAVRIAAKKLRYAGEFFAGVFPGRKTRDYLHEVAEIQKELGYLNDTAVARQRLAPLATNDKLRGALAGWAACREEHGLERLSPAWDGWRQAKRFWRDKNGG